MKTTRVAAGISFFLSLALHGAQAKTAPQDTMPDLTRAVETVQSDLKAAKIPSQRAALVAHLVHSLPNAFAASTETDEAQRICWRLANLKAAEAASILARYTSFQIQVASTENRSDRQYPASTALSDMGSAVVPAVLAVLADGQLVRSSTNYRPSWYDRLAPEDVALLHYYPEGPVFGWVSRLASPQNVPNTEILIVSEYKQKAARLRLLTASFPIPANDATPDAPKVPIEVPTLFASGDEPRITKILEQHYILTDQLAPATEAQVLSAITASQTLNAFELAPDLCDKLDPTPLPKVKNPLPADPKGRLSPSISDASETALRSMGRAALPALLDAVSTAGRSPLFRQKALTLLLAAAQTPASARTLLENAALDNDQRAARLQIIVGNQTPLSSTR